MKRRLCTIILLSLGLVCHGRAGDVQPGTASLLDTVSPASWSLLIEATMTGVHDSLATLGVRPDATADYDAHYEIPRPPPPPGTSIQVYFPHEGGSWPSILGTKFAVDYTDPVDPGWIFVVETNASPGPVTLQWDTSGINQLPDSYQVIIRDSTTGTLLYPRDVNSYTFSYTVPRTFRVWVEYTSTFISIHQGWNLVSVPRIVNDHTKPGLFPGGISPAYEYNDGYITRDTLSNGKGYWIKFPSADIVNQTGLGIDTLDIPVRAGWNLIGSVSGTVPVPASSNISSLFYDYQGGYHAADSLVPGRGYWIKVIADGILTVGSSGSHSFPATTSGPGGVTPRTVGVSIFRARVADTFTIADPGGASVALIGLPEEDFTAPELFDLPPAPPAGAFDARFSTGRIAGATVPAPGSPREFTVIVQSAADHFTFAITAGSDDYRYEILNGPGLWRAISSGSEPVAIACDPGRTILRLRATVDGPATEGFLLGPNFPNPFNPSTEIGFTLPEDAFTELSVTDMAGRIIQATTGNILNAGPHRFVFDAPANGMSSGAYIFRLGATGIRTGTRYDASRKILFLK